MSKHLLQTALLLSTLTATSALAAPTFLEEMQFGTSATIPIAWGDLDLNGTLDLIVGNAFNQQNFLYLNNGDGTFAEVNRFGQRNTFALAIADCDNDGDPDVAMGNGGNQQNRLWLGNGDGTFIGKARFGTNATNALAWADADLDGDLDLAVGNGILGSDQQNYLYRNDGGDVFTAIPLFGISQSDCVVWGDFDGDGDPDLAVGNGGFAGIQQNYLYVNNGDGTFTEVAQFGTGDTACLVWGDSDNDGDLDLAVANWNGGQNKLYVNNGDGSFAELDRFGLRDPNTFAWGDADNDGDLDLAVGNGDFGSADQNYLYRNDGGNTFTEHARFGLGSTDGVAWGDYDNDGDLDLAAGNEHTTTQNFLYVNQENDSDWLFLHLVGRRADLGSGYSNRDGIGAKVAVYESGFLGNPANLLGVREIESHGGFASGNQIDAHFGLPGQSSVDVRVVWPGSDGSNLTDDYLGVSVPGRQTLTEGNLPTAAPAPERKLGAWKVSPNPTSGEVALHLGVGRTSQREIRIYDAAGRQVRRLAATTSPNGLDARWDGRTTEGRAAPSGIYFARVAGEEASARIVLRR